MTAVYVATALAMSMRCWLVKVANLFVKAVMLATPDPSLHRPALPPKTLCAKHAHNAVHRSLYSHRVQHSLTLFVSLALLFARLVNIFHHHVQLYPTQLVATALSAQLESMPSEHVMERLSVTCHAMIAPFARRASLPVNYVILHRTQRARRALLVLLVAGPSVLAVARLMLYVLRAKFAGQMSTWLQTVLPIAIQFVNLAPLVDRAKSRPKHALQLPMLNVQPAPFVVLAFMPKFLARNIATQSARPALSVVTHVMQIMLVLVATAPLSCTMASVLRNAHRIHSQTKKATLAACATQLVPPVHLGRLVSNVSPVLRAFVSVLVLACPAVVHSVTGLEVRALSATVLATHVSDPRQTTAPLALQGPCSITARATPRTAAPKDLLQILTMAPALFAPRTVSTAAQLHVCSAAAAQHSGMANAWLLAPMVSIAWLPLSRHVSIYHPPF